MSDYLQEDPSWRDAARGVARELDRNNVQSAQNMLREDLFQLQGNPRGQHEFINMVNQYEHKGIGADFQISRGPNGQEMWQILPVNYGRDSRYPAPPPVQQQPDVVIVQPQQPSPGERLVEGIVTGAGIGIGLGVMDRVLNNRHHHHRR